MGLRVGRLGLGTVLDKALANDVARRTIGRFSTRLETRMRYRAQTARENHSQSLAATLITNDRIAAANPGGTWGW